MMTLRLTLSGLLPIALLSGCWFTDEWEDLLDGHLCESNVQCIDEWSCVDGVCVEGSAPDDAGPDDAGPDDAGPVDAGFVDAGFDAGPSDAGFDAGYDAGPPANSAPVLDSANLSTNGVTATLTVLVTDPDHASVELSIVWQTGGSVELVTVMTGSARSIQHSYARAGTYAGSIFATDGAGAQSNTLVVTPVAALPSSGLLLHMKFDSDLNDETGKTVTDYGTIGYVDDRHGFGSRAIDMYNGNSPSENPLLSMPTLAGMTESFSIAVWVRPVTGSINNKRIIGQGDWMNLNAPSNNVYFMELDGLSAADSGPQVGGTETPVDIWAFYVGVAEKLGPGSTQITFYKDATAVETQTLAIELDNPGSCRFYLGHFPASDLCADTESDEFTGLNAYMDDVRVFARALTADEVSALFYEGM